MPLPTLGSIDRAGRVIYMNTFSQTISPGMRVSYLVLPERLLDAWRERLGFYSCAVPVLEQLVLARFISSGGYERHLARLRKACREWRARSLAAFGSGPLAGRVELLQPGAGLHFSHARGHGPGRTPSCARGPRRCGCASPSSPTSPSTPSSAPEHVLVVNYAGLSAGALADAQELLRRALDGEEA